MDENDDQVKIYLRLEGKIAERYSQIKSYLSLKNDTEIMRSLINWYWQQHQKDLKPRLEHFNLSENGVLIVDHDLDRIVQVYFKPNKVLCEYDESSDCKHVDFALELPEVQELLKKRGWKPQ